MPVTRITCDQCGVDTSDFVIDYDGITRCKRCGLVDLATATAHDYDTERNCQEAPRAERLKKLLEEMNSASNALKSYDELK